MSATETAGRPLHAELAGYRREIQAIREDANRLVDGLSEAQLQWSPSPERWSIAQCLDHLNNGWLALTKLDRAMTRAAEQGVRSEGPYRHPLLGRLYVRFTEPPPKLRVPAPKAYRPKPAPPATEVVPRFFELQDEIAKRVVAADGLDLGKIRSSSPISRRFRMSLGQWFGFLLAHERRHLWQAWQVRKHPRFPN